MMNGMSELAFTALLSLFTGGAGNIQGTAFDPYALEWSCQEVAWQREPSVTQGVFRGTIGVKCALTSTIEGDYKKLAQFSLEEIKQKAVTIHTGPTAEEYQGLPSTHYDATVTVNEEGVETVRGDMHVATNGTDRFIAASFSKEITATGMAKHLKKMDNVVELQRGKTANSHDVTILVTSHVQKPAIIPAAKFKQMVMEQMEEKLVAKEQELIESLINHM